MDHLRKVLIDMNAELDDFTKSCLNDKVLLCHLKFVSRFCNVWYSLPKTISIKIVNAYIEIEILNFEQDDNEIDNNESVKFDESKFYEILNRDSILSKFDKESQMLTIDKTLQEYGLNEIKTHVEGGFQYCLAYQFIKGLLNICYPVNKQPLNCPNKHMNVCCCVLDQSRGITLQELKSIVNCFIINLIIAFNFHKTIFSIENLNSISFHSFQNLNLKKKLESVEFIIDYFHLFHKFHRLIDDDDDNETC
jgi:hypothetical protein